MVAKIHRDLFLEPKNDPEGIASLPDVWRQALTRLLREHTPVFVGYGGNDGSLMGFLESLSTSDLVGRLRWCYREADGLPQQRVIDLVSKLDGVLVPIVGFDELMLVIGNEMEFGLRDRYVRNRGMERADVLRRQFEALAKSVLGTHAEPEVDEAGQEARRAIGQVLDRTDSSTAYMIRANQASDGKDKVAVLVEGLERFPEDPMLLGYAASMMAEHGEETRAKALAHKALATDALPSSLKAGLLSIVLQDFEAGDRAYAEHTNADPDDYLSMSDWAESWLARGHPQIALEHLARARKALNGSSSGVRIRHAPLSQAVLRVVALTMRGEVATEEIASVRSLLNQGIRAETFSLHLLQKTLPQYLTGEELSFVLTLLEVMVGRKDVSVLDEFKLWTAAEGETVDALPSLQ